MHIWNKKPYQPSAAEKHFIYYLSRLFNVSPFIIYHLFSNGMRNENTIQSFLFPHPSQLHNPFLFAEMEQACSRTLLAIERKETIVIFGDYDVDGMTSTSSLYLFLQSLGADVHYRLPLRTEGYGLTPEMVDILHETFCPHLVITVDNGSSSHDALERAASLAIDVIVTDHHEVLLGRPRCTAFINPKYKTETYPFRELCGAGVAYKFIHGLCIKSGITWTDEMWKYAELAAIGTIADMVPLEGENRAIATFGIKKLNQRPSPFFKQLLSSLRLSEVWSTDISFRLAPLFNSMGRIDDANNMVKFITKPSLSDSEIQMIVSIDKKRKSLTAEEFLMADEQISKYNKAANPLIVVSGPFTEGIIGIISARISNKYAKPSIVISDETGKASARSAPNTDFSIIEAISSCHHLLKKYGGHRAAAGFSIDRSNISLFETQAVKNCMGFVSPPPVTEYHLVLPLEHLTPGFVGDLKMLEPFGMGNPKPIFRSPRSTFEYVDYFGKNLEFFKLRSNVVEALSFLSRDLPLLIPPIKADILYSVENERQVLLTDIQFIGNEKTLLKAIG